MTHDGIFTQPGPDGIFGRGGDPQDASSPPIDSDDTPLRETLMVVYPSPGHMRVARAIRHPKSGKVEFQEEYRVPTPEEVQLLKQQGVVAGPGSMVTSPMAGIGDVAPAPLAPPAAAEQGQPWVKMGVALAVGVAGFWAVNKWVVPMFGGKAGGSDEDEGEVEVESEDVDE